MMEKKEKCGYTKDKEGRDKGRGNKDGKREQGMKTQGEDMEMAGKMNEEKENEENMERRGYKR